MALPDDLNRLAQQDVVYLTTTIASPQAPAGGGIHASTTTYRGRLRQALSGNWVFNTSTGQNGVAGINLGAPGDNWASNDTPAGGLQVTLTNTLVFPQPPQMMYSVTETITLMSVIPADLAD